MNPFFSFGIDFVKPLRSQLNLSQAKIRAADGPSESVQNDVENGRYRTLSPDVINMYRNAFTELHDPDAPRVPAPAPADLFSAAAYAMNAEPETTPIQVDAINGDGFALNGFDQYGNQYGQNRPRYAAALRVSPLEFSPADADTIAELLIAPALRAANVVILRGGTFKNAAYIAGNRRLAQFNRPDLFDGYDVPPVVIDPLWQVRSLAEATRVLSALSYQQRYPWAPIVLLAASRAAWNASGEDPLRDAISAGASSPGPQQYLPAARPSNRALAETLDLLTGERSVFLAGPTPAEVAAARTHLERALNVFQENFLASLVSSGEARELALAGNAIRSVEHLLADIKDQAVIVGSDDHDDLGSLSVLAGAIRAAYDQLGEMVSVALAEEDLKEVRMMRPLTSLKYDIAEAGDAARVVYAGGELTIVEHDGTLYAQRHEPLKG